MTNEVKTKIQELLQTYCDGYSSQAKAAKSLDDVSGGTISQVLNGNWALISDKMWLNIGKQVGYKTDEWVIADTENQKTIHDLLLDGKQNARVHAIIGRASWGKDTGIIDFKRKYSDVFQVNCSKFLTDRYLIIELLKSMGETTKGPAYKMSEKLVAAINKLSTPVIVLNEYEKLAPPAFLYFITLFNLTENKASIILSGTPYLRKRIEDGIASGKAGYDEIYSRIGSKFIELDRPSRKDVKAICNANGVTEQDKINDIYEEFKKSDYDLRRVKKLVQNVALDRQLITQ